MSASAIKTDGQNVVTFKTSWRQSYPTSSPSSDLSTYLGKAVNYVSNYDLAAGAQLVHTDQPDRFNLKVKQLEFMGVVIQPTALVAVHSTNKGIQITTEECVIEGSEQVQQLGLSDRFDVDVVVGFEAGATDSLDASAEMVLHVDIPFPFNLTPKPVFEAGGNLVISALMEIMMGTFSQSVVSDYQKWALKN